MAIGEYLRQAYSVLTSLISLELVGLLFSALLVLFAYWQTRINRDQKELVQFQHTSFPALEDWDVIGPEEYFEYTDEQDYTLNALTSQFEFVELELSNFSRSHSPDRAVESSDGWLTEI